MTTNRVKPVENQLARELLNCSRDVIVALDEQGVILVVSDSISKTFGWSPEEVVGKAYGIFFDDSCVTSSNEYLAESFDSEPNPVQPLIAKRVDGSCFPCELSLHRLSSAETNACYLGVLRDVSALSESRKSLRNNLERLNKTRRALKRKEYELIASQKNVYRARQAKSEFLANMSHEFRTPMTTILGYTELLRENLYSANQEDLVEIIHKNGTHLLQIITDILDISKIEMGDFEILKHECSLETILQVVVSDFLKPAREKGISIFTQIAPDVPEQIITDPVRLEQVLWNLLSNAVKFTESGRIDVRVKVCPSPTKEQMVQFEIADTGIGIPTEKLKRIFEPFSQVDNSSSRNYGGTGVGLALCKKLVQLLGGHLSVQSKVDQGSLFCVSLDHHAEVHSQNREDAAGLVREVVSGVPQGQQPSGQKKQLGGAKGKVLLVDDTKEIRTLFSYMLNKMGIEVETASNGQEAVTLLNQFSLQRSAFDMILMDMQMPVMNGYEATQLIRQQGYQLPVIAITAHSLITDREKCLAAGCTEYLSKPIRYEVLHEVVHCYLSQNAAILSH